MFFKAEEKLIAGGPSDILNVRHLTLRGTNREIGKELARIARDRHKFKLAKSSDPFKTRVRRDYVARNYPQMYERMKGVAELYGVSPESDHDLLSLDYNMEMSIGCSTVFYPPSHNTTGHGILSRNYDFSTKSFAEVVGAPPVKGARSMTGDPYLIEMYPDRGYASLAICAYDLLAACIDGINSEGLTVALLADDESNNKHQMEPTQGSQVGFNEIEITRFLLDTCACVEDAKQALLTVKQYYSFIPCHYIIADRHGKSFIWEYSHAHNKEYIIDGDGPQVITNHGVHNYKTVADMPVEPSPFSSYTRFRTLKEKAARKLTMEEMIAANCSVSVTYPTGTDVGSTPHRTLWHSVYDTEERSVNVDFYLSESGGGLQKRSGYMKFALDR